MSRHRRKRAYKRKQTAKNRPVVAFKELLKETQRLGLYDQLNRQER